MVMMLAPMWFLFEAAVIVVGVFEKKREQAFNEVE
jgi:sec-independent protein translocase protein TatC